MFRFMAAYIRTIWQSGQLIADSLLMGLACILALMPIFYLASLVLGDVRLERWYSVASDFYLAVVVLGDGRGDVISTTLKIPIVLIALFSFSISFFAATVCLWSPLRHLAGVFKKESGYNSHGQSERQFYGFGGRAATRLPCSPAVRH